MKLRRILLKPLRRRLNPLHAIQIPRTSGVVKPPKVPQSFPLFIGSALDQEVTVLQAKRNLQSVVTESQQGQKLERRNIFKRNLCFLSPLAVCNGTHR